jgi:abortive infection bacteriophage resistance protein
MIYEKPPTTFEEQLAIFMQRGLIVPDEQIPFALQCLEHHNYYRLSAYRFPLSNPESRDEFLPDTTFDQLWGLYSFDRQLRLLVMEGVKRLEISARTHWTYHFAHEYGTQAYERPELFYNQRRHEHGMEKLDGELARSDEVFVSHYRNQYEMTRPPIWAACEVMSFGLLSRFYENIKSSKVRKKIARTYELFPDTMKSLLQHSVYIRNLCAHHSRLWNRRFTVTLALPERQPTDLVASFNPEANRRIYNTLVMLAHVVNIIEPENHWSRRLRALLHAQTFPVTERMGFPVDWETRPIWNTKAQQHSPKNEGTPS